jgi:hypothetical protein
MKGTGMNTSHAHKQTNTHTHTQTGQKEVWGRARHTGSKWLTTFRKKLAPNQLLPNNASHSMWQTVLNPSIAPMASYESVITYVR